MRGSADRLLQRVLWIDVTSDIRIFGLVVPHWRDGRVDWKDIPVEIRPIARLTTSLQCMKARRSPMAGHAVQTEMTR